MGFNPEKDKLTKHKTNKINNPLNKPLVNKACSNFEGPRQGRNKGTGQGVGLGAGFGQNKSFGQGLGQRRGMTSGITNPTHGMANQGQVQNRIKQVLDQLPEVKKASGDLKIQLDGGDVIEVKLNYIDGGQ